MSGQRLLHYETIEVLGQGGMGTVYKARDTRLNRLVALKVFARDKVRDADRRQRFMQEAQAASSLNHPHIVTIYDIGQADGDWFIAMEDVPGTPLSRLIPHKGMPLGDVLRYAIQIADALACAHAAGIVHRDLKPANVMVTANGATKLVDFGLAKKLLATPAWSDNETDALDLRTLEGTVLGTAACMSPEQAEGREVDGRSDVFSFGAMLHEMATGQRAFRGEWQSPRWQRCSVRTRSRSRESCRASSRRSSSAACGRSRRGDSRAWPMYASCWRMSKKSCYRQAQSGLVAQPSCHVRHRGHRSHRHRRGGMVPRRTPPAAGAAGNGDAACDVSGGEGLSGDLLLDGGAVAFSWRRPGSDNFDLYVLQVGGGPPVQRTTSPEDDHFPSWSPDGHTIVFVRGTPFGSNEIIAIPTLGGPEQHVMSWGGAFFGPYVDG